MRKLIITLALVLLCGASFADQAVQSDQNAGFLTPATATWPLYVGSFTEILITAPANVASWTAANPTGQFLVLPARTRGFRVNVAGCDMIVGDPSTMSTGANYVGCKVTSGQYFVWSGLRPDQRTIHIRLMNNGSTNGTATISAWGE